MQQVGDRAADDRGGEGRAGDGIGAAVDRRQHVDAGRRDEDVGPAVGLRHQLVVGVGRRHGDDAGIGGRIAVGRLGPVVAGRRDQHHAARARAGAGRFQQLVVRPDEAHVDDAHVLAGRPVERVEDDVHGRLAALEGARMIDRGARRHAAERPDAGDQPGDRGAVVAVRPARRRAWRRYSSAIDAVERRMRRVDRGVDDGDADVARRWRASESSEMRLNA